MVLIVRTGEFSHREPAELPAGEIFRLGHHVSLP
jgi:hypothetical protein